MQSNSRVCCSQRAKAALARVVTNEEHWTEFWLAQSCVVAKWNFTLYGLLYVVWKTEKLASRTFIHDRHVFKAWAIRSFHKWEKWKCSRIPNDVAACIPNDVSQLNIVQRTWKNKMATVSDSCCSRQQTPILFALAWFHIAHKYNKMCPLTDRLLLRFRYLQHEEHVLAQNG